MNNKICFAIVGLMILGVSAAGRQPAEKLDRGFLAVVRSPSQVYLGWRLLKDDPKEIGFHLYRLTDGGQPVKLTSEPIVDSTNFVDESAPLDKPNQWRLTAIVAGKETTAAVVHLPANAPIRSYISIPFRGDYVCSKVAIADLNGDGRYDFVIKQPQQTTDPGVWQKSTDTFKVEAYLHDGTFLWRKDLGWNIEQGVWWSPMVVFDFDGDGRAEVALKTAPTDVDYRNPDDHPFPGRVMSGPEYITLLDGMTGKELDRADWPPRGRVEDWGDEKNNRASRHLLGVAYLDGVRPSLIVLRGTYTRMYVDAYNVVQRRLVKVWSWDGDRENPPVRGQGMHGMHAADVDGDGRDEIILGAAVLDDNGKILWNTGLGHPDACYVTDIYPDRPGLEIIYGIEPPQPKNGICVADAKTGQILWGCEHPTTHVHSQGLFGEWDPGNPGYELYTGEKDRSRHWTYSVSGRLLSQEPFRSLAPTPLYWLDGPLKMIAEAGRIGPYKGRSVGEFEGRILAAADILGDWREELITTVPGELRIYTTTSPSKQRRTALMQDPIYRLDVAMVSMGYFYPPQLSEYFALDKPAFSEQ
jgi:rhamnogalacturonan endolyase